MNTHVGRLGIFVSADVAKREHRVILDKLGALDALEPGLYEMKIDDPIASRGSKQAQYDVRFEERRVEQIRYTYPARSFENVQALSEWNDMLYRTTLGPWIRAFASPFSATLLTSLHPMRTSRLLFSDRLNPWMLPVAAMATAVSGARSVAGEDNPLVKLEYAASTLITGVLDIYRQLRDASNEALFTANFGARGGNAIDASPAAARR